MKIRRPGHRAETRQLPHVRTVRVHRVEIHRAVAVRGERDLFRIRRPARIAILALRAVRQIFRIAAHRIDEENLRVAGAGGSQQKLLAVEFVSVRRKRK